MSKGDDSKKREGISRSAGKARSNQARSSKQIRPQGIERLLELARENEEFKERLLLQRGAVASAAGLELTASEKAILESISPQHLLDMVGHLHSPSASRREFLARVASGALLVLSGAHVLASNSPAWANERQQFGWGSASTGARPDYPPDFVRGIAPDFPEPIFPADEDDDGSTDEVVDKPFIKPESQPQQGPPKPPLNKL